MGLQQRSEGQEVRVIAVQHALEKLFKPVFFVLQRFRKVRRDKRVGLQHVGQQATSKPSYKEHHGGRLRSLDKTRCSAD